MPGYNGMIQGSEHGSIFRQFGDYKGISGDSGSDDEDPDGVLIAGDIYDRSVPPAEAVTLLDSFINQLAKKKKYKQ